MNAVDVQVRPDDTKGSAQSEKMKDTLAIFGASLAKTRDEWIRARQSAGVDRRMKDDADQYHAIDAATKIANSMMQTVEQGYPSAMGPTAQPTRSSIFVGITRQKTNAAEARLADIVLPTDDRNYSFDPTANPMLAQGMSDGRQAVDPRTGQPGVDAQGQPLKVSDVAGAIAKMAHDRCQAMQNLVDDQLEECDYNGEVRKVIHDAAVFGTGVLKGPVVLNKSRKAWLPDASGQFTMEVVEDLAPASFRVDPRNCFPDPACGDNLHNGSGHFERCVDTPKQLRDLQKQPGYFKEQLSDLLETKPSNRSAFRDLTKESSRDPAADDVYERFIYVGDVPHDALVAAGVIGEEDVLESYSAVVEFVGSTVVRMYQNPLEDGEIPYDYYPWEKVVDSVWGYGIPYLMRSQQQVTNAAWRQLMDNGGLISGPQIVMKPGSIQPANKRWEMTGRKLWWATDETQDVNKAFAVIQITAQQDQLSKILELSEKIGDQETAVPMLAQGAQNQAPETVGVSQMMMNSANVVLRRLVKQFDDFITKPHITRYYNYNMLYAEDAAVKGDFSVVARGSAALIIRDIQNQAFTNLLNIAANPVYAPLIDAKKLFEKALRAQHVDPLDIMRDDQAIEKAQQAQQAMAQKPDPRVQAAEVRAQADVKRTEAQMQSSESELGLRQQIAEQNHAARLAEMQLKREIAILDLAIQQQISVEQIKGQLADRVIADQTKKDMAAADAHLQALAPSPPPPNFQ